jgi:hypothetical protein
MTVLRRRRSHQTLLVMRFMLMSNGVILAGFGLLYALFGSRPTGYIVGGVLGAAAIGLWMAIPLTDPYRDERGRHRNTW